MSLLGEKDEQAVSHPQFGWFEQRMEQHKSVTVANTTGAFATTAATPVDQASPFTSAAGTSITVFVAGLDQFRVRDVIWVRNVVKASGYGQVKGVVTAKSAETGSGYLTVHLIIAATALLNAAATVGLDVFVIGSATGEGDRSRTGAIQRPVEMYNLTQIFRTAFSLTRTALKVPLRYDQKGDHRNKAQQNALRHSIIMENAFIFSELSSANVTNDDGETVPRRTMNGVMGFLKQWELGNTTNGGLFDYRPGGADVSASAWATTDEKRILNINGAITKRQFNMLMERAFRKCNDNAQEKLVLCGSGFYSVFNDFMDQGTIVQRRLFENGKGGFDFKEWESPFGTIFLKTHPLFNEHVAHRYSALFLDMGLLGYRYLSDSDTTLLTNRQLPDADKRKDEWITECSLELNFPEGFMFWENVTEITI